MYKTKHFLDMLKERAILEKWVDRTLQNPEKTEEKKDGTHHFLKKISEHENRWLRVVVNTEAIPHRAVTVFFDRKMRRTHEN